MAKSEQPAEARPEFVVIDGRFREWPPGTVLRADDDTLGALESDKVPYRPATREQVSISQAHRRP